MSPKETHRDQRRSKDTRKDTKRPKETQEDPKRPKETQIYSWMVIRILLVPRTCFCQTPVQAQQFSPSRTRS